MAKMTFSQRFVSNLIAAFGARSDATTIDLYNRQLAKWKCAEAIWSRTLSRLIADFEFLPSLAKIYEYLQLAERDARKARTQGYLLFDFEGRRYAIRFDPANPSRPEPPIGATNIATRILGDAYDEPATPEEAKEAFMRGWIESGADPSKCPTMRQVIKGIIPGHQLGD